MRNEPTQAVHTQQSSPRIHHLKHGSTILYICSWSACSLCSNCPVQSPTFSAYPVSTWAWNLLSFELHNCLIVSSDYNSRPASRTSPAGYTPRPVAVQKVFVAIRFDTFGEVEHTRFQYRASLAYSCASHGCSGLPTAHRRAMHVIDGRAMPPHTRFTRPTRVAGTQELGVGIPTRAHSTIHDAHELRTNRSKDENHPEVDVSPTCQE